MADQPDTTQRVAPHNPQAEESLLGAMLLSRDAIDAGITICTAEDFYRPTHGHIFAAISDLYTKGEAVDPVTVADELERAGLLAPIGGLAELLTLSTHTPTTSNAARYATIVAEHARLRRLIATCTVIADMAYGAPDDVDGAVERAAALLDAVGGRTVTRRGPVRLGEAVGEWLDSVDARLAGDPVTMGFGTGWSDLDAKLGGFRPGQLVVIGARPAVGKSGSAVGLALHVAALGIGVLLVSAEMGLGEVTERVLAAETNLRLDTIKSADLSDAAWPRIVHLIDRNLPIWVLDDQHVSLPSLASAFRQLRTRATETVGLVIVDYLQLMKGVGRSENRQAEVAELSRGLKRFARDAGVPVVALSSLSRAVESRSDKRPVLSDLRECLTGDSVVVDPVTGEWLTIAKLHAANRVAPVMTLGRNMRLQVQPAGAVASGVKPVFLVRTQSGREIRASGNHPFLTIDGWKPLESLAVGEDVAVPRCYPEPDEPSGSITADEARLLGYLVSNGSYANQRSVSLTHHDRAVIADATAISERRFGLTPRPRVHWCGTLDIAFTRGHPNGGGHGPGSNPVINWLKRLGIHDQLGPVKQVPADLFRCSNETVAQFIGGLWAGDGSVIPMKKGAWSLKYTSTSRVLLHQVQHLLLRLGVLARITPPTRHEKSTVDIADVMVTGKGPIAKFAEWVSIVGEKGEKLNRATAWAQDRPRESRMLDRLPLVVRDRVLALAAADGRSWGDLDLGKGFQADRRPSRARVLAFAEQVRDQALADLASSHILWDAVVLIEPAGEEMTFDLVVPQNRNFVANDVFVHNSGSLESDADVVILLYRDEMYDPASAARGICEVNVAKQRNGPTGVVRLRYDGRTGRFTDIPREDSAEPLSMNYDGEGSQR